jgi:hypothetical protein
VPAERTAVLVIRAWAEEALDQPVLRARITRTLDISEQDVVQTMAASEDEIIAAVRGWLQELADLIAR